VERHVALIAVAEIRPRILRPLIGLGEQHFPRIAFVEMPAKFPQRTITAQRLIVIALERGYAAAIRLANVLGRAMWAEQRDLEDDDTLRGLVEEAGMPREWVERTREPDVKAALAAHTAQAKAAGVFGVPTWIVDDQYLFWGQDRLELVMRALGGWRPVHG